MRKPYKWTKQKLREEASKYKYRSDFKKNSSSAYSICAKYHKDILNELYGKHCKQQEFKGTKWIKAEDVPEALLDARPHRSEFKTSKEFSLIYDKWRHYVNMLSPEYHEWMINKGRKYCKSEHAKEIQRKRRSCPEYKAKHNAYMKTEKQRKRVKEYQSKPEVRKRIKEIYIPNSVKRHQKRMKEDPEYRKKIRETKRKYKHSNKGKKAERDYQIRRDYGAEALEIVRASDNIRKKIKEINDEKKKAS